MIIALVAQQSWRIRGATSGQLESYNRMNVSENHHRIQGLWFTPSRSAQIVAAPHGRRPPIWAALGLNVNDPTDLALKKASNNNRIMLLIRWFQAAIDSDRKWLTMVCILAIIINIDDA